MLPLAESIGQPLKNHIAPGEESLANISGLFDALLTFRNIFTCYREGGKSNHQGKNMMYIVVDLRLHRSLVTAVRTFQSP